jgi:hypothetical protein
LSGDALAMPQDLLHIESRKNVIDPKPRRFEVDVDMLVRTDPRVVIQQAGCDLEPLRFRVWIRNA